MYNKTDFHSEVGGFDCRRLIHFTVEADLTGVGS